MKRKQLVDYIKRALATEGKKSLPFDIVAALLFGSWAKGSETPDSDIDLLIVADRINTKLHRRGKEIADIKHCIPGLSLDVQLLTKEEVISNFRNHNPLFLDIAIEGIIILDKDKFLRNLMLETKEYLKQRGIKRFGDGWIFPVEKGVPTYLSRVSNKDFSYAMLKDGERDFQIGERLIKDGFYDKAVYHFQQSVEKAIKAVLIAMGVFQKTHFIGEVLRGVISKKDIPIRWKPDLIEVAEISEEIEPEVSLSRYPGIIDDSLWLPFDEYEKEDADRAMEKAVKALSVARGFVEDWFSKTI
ncbi:MAG: HEPN domain-containing protein [Thermodesulfovibrionales bacterium]